MNSDLFFIFRRTISESKLSFYLIGSALLLFYVADGVNKYLQLGAIDDGGGYQDAFSLSIYFRFLYEVIFISIIIINLNFTRRKIVLAILLMVLIFLIGNVTFLLNYNSPGYSLPFHFSLLNKYIFVFTIYGAIYKVVENWKDFNIIMKLYSNLVIFNSILIFVGLILKIALFQSYSSIALRYGYDGLIPSVNEATLYYFIAISYFYYNHFILKNKDWKFYFVILASFLLGTKTIYLYLVILFLYHLFINLSFVKRFTYIALASIIIPVLIVPVIVDPKYAFLYSTFAYFYEQHGFWFMITSGRSEYIGTKFIDNLNHWNVINYLFGGTNQLQFMMEMDFFDLFLFGGLFGFMVIFYLYFKTIFKNVNKIKFLNFFAFCYFLFAFLSGHIFISGTNALNLAVICIFLKSNNHCITNEEILN